MANRLEKLAFKNASKRRHAMFLRAGTGRGDPQYRMPSGGDMVTGVVAPLRGFPAALVWTMEFFGVEADPIGDTLYPAGTILDTGKFTVKMSNVGVLDLQYTSSTSVHATIDLADPSLPGGGTPARGVHTIVAYANPLIAQVALFVDGYQVDFDKGAGGSIWTDSRTDFDYMVGVTDVGVFSDLQIFPNYTPAIFVPLP